MSGHSKWSTIKRQKGVTDAKRSQLFTKLIRAITIAARTGPDPVSNFKLRLAIDRARLANMPKDNIERAIKRGSGEDSTVILEEVVYEVYGPGGAALIIEAITDNRNRISGEVKNVLSHYGGRLAEANSVRWQFESTGIIQLPLPNKEMREQLELELIESGAQDLIEEADQLVIYTQPADLEKIKKILEQKKLTVDYSQVELVANNPVNISSVSDQKKLDNLKNELDALDDVDNIYTNEA
ncbi:MAG: YebC/PmpR family DNA-binding transcriptional regulator [Patescibacteria group bacterium]